MQTTTLEELHRALARARRGSLTIGEDGSSFFVHGFGLTRFKSLPELSKFVAEVNGVRPSPAADAPAHQGGS